MGSGLACGGGGGRAVEQDVEEEEEEELSWVMLSTPLEELSPVASLERWVRAAMHSSMLRSL